MVTEEMREAGSQIASDLMNAQVSFHIGGLGGSKNVGGVRVVPLWEKHGSDQAIRQGRD